MPDNIPAEFKALAVYLCKREVEIGQGVHNKAQRPWMDFKELSGEVSNFDIDGLHKNFDRQSANDKYMAAKKKDEATEEEIVAPKMAADFLAACERDFADMRKRSRIRMMVHGGVVQRLNGQDEEGNSSVEMAQLYVDTVGLINAIINPKFIKNKPSKP